MLEFRRLVVTSKGRGIGRRAVQEVVTEAFVRRHAHRLWLDVFLENQRARSLYESEGFVVERVVPATTAPNDPRRLVILSMQSEDYLRRS